MQQSPTKSPWALPKLHAPAAIKMPSKRGRFNASNGLYSIPSRASINTVTTKQSDRTDMIKRGGR